MPGVSRHEMLFCTFVIPNAKTQPRVIKYRNFNNIPEEDLLERAAEMPWNEVYEMTSVNDMVAHITTLIMFLINLFAPEKVIKLRHPKNP